MDIKTLGQALRSGKRVYGTLIVSPSPRWPQTMRGMDLDFVFIDIEHVAIDRNELSWMCQMYEAMNMPPIVRVPAPDPYMVTMALDGGARGVVAPYMESVDEVYMLRESIKCRPLRGQYGHRAARGERFGDELHRYMGTFNQDNLLIVNIESEPAVNAIDEILSVPDIDGILVGPHDLTCSLGVPEQYDHPKFRAALKTIFSKARERGIGAGIHYSGDAKTHIEFAQLGCNMIVHSSDVVIFTKQMQIELNYIREAFGDQPYRAGANPSADASGAKPI